jgi:hypothetical protein
VVDGVAVGMNRREIEEGLIALARSEEPTAEQGLQAPPSDQIYEALQAVPPTELGRNQRHAVDVSLASILPQAEDVFDRNGKPTGEKRFSTQAPFSMTLGHLGQIRALIERDARVKYTGRIGQLERELAHAIEARRCLQVDRDDLAAQVRTHDRASREDKIQERIRQACEEYGVRLQASLRELKALVSTLQSENAELREAKRRLKMSRRAG